MATGNDGRGHAGPSGAGGYGFVGGYILGADQSSAAESCPWRTPSHNYRECSRFHDCPSHTIERTETGDTRDPSSSSKPGRAAPFYLPTSCPFSPSGGAGPSNVGGALSPQPYQHAPAYQQQAVIHQQHPHYQHIPPRHHQPVGPPPRSLGAVPCANPFPRATLPTPAHPGVIDLSNPLGQQHQPPSHSQSSSAGNQPFMDARAFNLAQGTTAQPVSSNTPPSRGSHVSLQSSWSGSGGGTRSLAPHPNTSSSSTRAEHQRDQGATPPRWQPDTEVSHCPICLVEFGMFIRRHHCRKCGRVVCNACSPHRIIIPYQYIVRPPGSSTLALAQDRPFSAVLNPQGGYIDYESLIGGERVRLCNPCVPDPNTAPPQSQPPPSQNPLSLSQNPVDHQRPNLTTASPSLRNPYRRPSRNVHMRGRSASAAHGTTGFTPESFARYSSIHDALNQAASSRQGQPGLPFDDRLINAVPMPYRSYFPPNSPFLASSAAQTNRSLPPLPAARPEIDEEDECPVCHEELPQRSLPGFETLREDHINSCIVNQSSSFNSVQTLDGPSDPSHPWRSLRAIGMFPYIATEKDCADSAECIICLEEFEVGVPMARLECLCRFHKHCIGAWWEKNHGRCPVHHHD